MSRFWKFFIVFLTAYSGNVSVSYPTAPTDCLEDIEGNYDMEIKHYTIKQSANDNNNHR